LAEFGFVSTSLLFQSRLSDIFPRASVQRLFKSRANFSERWSHGRQKTTQPISFSGCHKAYQTAWALQFTETWAKPIFDGHLRILGDGFEEPMLSDILGIRRAPK
jgi:hypothetical protein